MNNAVEEVKSRVDIVDLIGSRISLVKAGRNFKAVCPFHSEKTPSFVISPDRQIWHCFGACQIGGDAISFLMKYENISFFEALRELALQTGVKLDSVDFEDKAWSIRQELFQINAIVSKFYSYILEKHKVGDKAREYLKNRGLNEKIINTFSLGLAPNNWDSLIKFATKKNISTARLEKAGLIIKGNKGFYDRFRDRIIFPLKDSRGNVIGFSGRLLSSEAKEAKYVNTPETDVYHKRETLYGIDKSGPEIMRNDKAIVVEGEFDFLSLFKNGYKNTVAIKGSALTNEQLKLLSRFTKNLILALDSDLAGSQTTKRAIQDGETFDFNMEVAILDFGKDPDEAIKNDPIKFKKSIQKPIAIYDYIIQLAKNKYPDNSAYEKKQIGAEVVPFISNIKNPIVQSHYIAKLSTIIDVSSDAVEKILDDEQKTTAKKKKPFLEPKQTVDRKEMLSTYLTVLIIQSPDPSKKLTEALEYMQITDLQIPSHQKILKALEEYLETSNNFDINKFTALLPPELRSVLDKIYLTDLAFFGEEISDANFKRLALESKRYSLRDNIKDLTQSKDSPEKAEKLEKLMVELSAIEKKLTVM